MACPTNKLTDTCNCTYSCGKHAKCCECIAYHRDLGEFPACFFSNKAETTYDRSLSALMKDRGAR